MKMYKACLALIVALLFLWGCGSENPIIEDEIEEYTVEDYDPALGGTLNLSVTHFKTLNPLFNRNPDLYQIQHLIYESLITFEDDMSVKPLLADSWTFVDGGQSIDFTLKKGVKWHDGTPFTADDVVFTFDVIKGNIKNVKNVSFYRNSLQSISGVQKINDNTVRFNFSKNIGNGLEVVTFPILPRHLFEGGQVQALENDSFPVVGTGKYKLTEHQKMRHLILSRNENYWNKKPYIDEVKVTIVPDDEAQLSLFENGDTDFVQPKIIDWGKYSDDKSVRSEEYPMQEYEFLGINFRRAQMQNPDLRRALAYSIDRERLVKNIYLGHGTTVDFPIPPHSWLYDNSKLQFGLNLELANDLLEEAGYQLNDSGSYRVDEKGNPLSLKLITNKDNPLREHAALSIKEDFGKVGIALEIELMEWDELEKQMNSGNYDLFLGGWDFSYALDLSLTFHSSNIGRGNFIGYSNEEMDNILMEAANANNPQIKQQKFSDLQELIAKEVPYISLMFRDGAVLARDKIKGDLRPTSYNVFNRIEDWYINTK